MSKKVLKGKVVSAKSAQTLVINVTRLKQHPKYKKRFTVSKRYKAHYDEGEYKIGDKVIIEESRPISKDKRWRVVGLVNESKKNKENSGGESEITNPELEISN